MPGCSHTDLSPSPIDPAWLRDRYLVDRLTCAQIAELLDDGTTARQVEAALYRAGITPARSRRVPAVLDDPGALAELLDGSSVVEVARELDVAAVTVRRRLQRFGIAEPARRSPLVEDRDWLAEQYVTLRRTAREIAAELGIGRSTLYVHLERHGVRR